MQANTGLRNTWTSAWWRFMILGVPSNPLYDSMIDSIILWLGILCILKKEKSKTWGRRGTLGWEVTKLLGVGS